MKLPPIFAVLELSAPRNPLIVRLLICPWKHRF